jgi:branched-subunit amino acid aminotransferase/4-amino-4-deoxychorismate lyase
MARMFCNGGPATVEDLAAAQTNYGHFTSMQVCDGAVQGLRLHVQRLQHATHCLFDAGLDELLLLQQMRAALAACDVTEASLRITVFSRQFDFRQPLRAVPLDVLIAVSPPVSMSKTDRRVLPVRFQREFAAIKHVGTFALFQQRRLAMQAGFDDALFVGPADEVIEGSTWNIAFRRGDEVVWPQADCLPGTCQALLEAQLAAHSLPMARRPVTLAQLAEFDGAVACNASGVWPVAAVGGHTFAGSEAFSEELKGLLAAIPWQPL